MLTINDLGRKLKRNMKNGLEIGRLSVLQSGLELDFFRSANRRLIQSMTKPPDYLDNMNLPGGREYNVQQYFTLNFELAPLICVGGLRLKGDFSWQGFRNCLRRFGFGLRRSDRSVPEATLANRVP